MANLKDLIVNGVARIVGNLSVGGKITTNGTEVATKSDISTLQTNFQAGVDGIYNAIVAQGTTPASKSLSDVKTGIGTLSANRYNAGVIATKVGTAVAGDVLSGKHSLIVVVLD